jgi:hypothetical protein
MQKRQTRPSAREKTGDPGADVRPVPAQLGPAELPAEATIDPKLARLAANRVVIESVSPEIDGGRFPAKAAVGDCFTVEADIFADGHDKIDAAFLSAARTGPSGRNIRSRSTTTTAGGATPSWRTTPATCLR